MSDPTPPIADLPMWNDGDRPGRACFYYLLEQRQASHLGLYAWKRKQSIERSLAMEFGHHCELSTCSRLSFLPITCPYCKAAFCESHYLTDQHACASAESTESVLSEEVFLQRLAASDAGGRLPCQRKGCKSLSFQLQTQPTASPTASTGSHKVFTHTAPRCDRCKGFFCAAHRSAPRHGCTSAAPLTEGQLKLKAVQDRKAKAASVLAKHFPNHNR